MDLVFYYVSLIMKGLIVIILLCEYVYDKVYFTDILAKNKKMLNHFE